MKVPLCVISFFNTYRIVECYRIFNLSCNVIFKQEKSRMISECINKYYSISREGFIIYMEIVYPSILLEKVFDEIL